MAGSKNKKGATGGAQSHIRARLAYLHKAATYILSQQQSLKAKPPTKDTDCENTATQTPRQTSEEEQHEQKSAIQACIPRHYISQMRGVSLKTQQRLSIETKRTFCKRCDLLLIPGVTCTQEIQNASKGQKKPWADVLVIRCSGCETEKRIPQSAKRSKKLNVRRQEEKKESRDQTAVS